MGKHCFALFRGQGIEKHACICHAAAAASPDKTDRWNKDGNCADRTTVLLFRLPRCMHAACAHPDAMAAATAWQQRKQAVRGHRWILPRKKYLPAGKKRRCVRAGHGCRQAGHGLRSKHPLISTFILRGYLTAGPGPIEKKSGCKWIQ